MQAVISILDALSCERVESLWKELERAFSIRATKARAPFPHLSYQGAAAYKQDQLQAALEDIAKETAPFEIETHGIGIFTGALPVLYIPVVRSPALLQLHQRVWHALESIGTEITTIYGAEHWIPHITLAQGDIRHDQLPDIMRLLSQRTFTWHSAITNLTVLETTSDTPDAGYRIATQIAFD